MQYSNSIRLFNRLISQKDSIVNEYNNGSNLKEIYYKYGAYRSVLVKLFKLWNVRQRNSNESRSIYSFDHEFFKKIDTEEKAYWLGFIYADGNVYFKQNKRYLFQIGLSIKDIDHLEKFKKSIKSNHNFYYSKNMEI